MKEIRLHEGELNVMELLWSNKALAARDISKIIKEYIGWEKNTTYAKNFGSNIGGFNLCVCRNTDRKTEGKL